MNSPKTVLLLLLPWNVSYLLLNTLLKFFSITYTLSGSFFQHLQPPEILFQSFKALVYFWHIHRIHRTPWNLSEHEKTPGISLIGKTLWLLFSTHSTCISPFSERLFLHLDQVAHFPFASTAPCILFTPTLTQLKFYLPLATVLHQQISCFQLFSQLFWTVLPGLIFILHPCKFWVITQQKLSGGSVVETCFYSF